MRAPWGLSGEELGGRAVSALSVRSQKLSIVRRGIWMGDQNLLSRAPPCFGRHVKQLAPAVFPVVSIHSSSKDYQEGYQAGRS
jgi:hypothetical protein